jgi:hypothetical protein
MSLAQQQTPSEAAHDRAEREQTAKDHRKHTGARLSAAQQQAELSSVASLVEAKAR